MKRPVLPMDVAVEAKRAEDREKLQNALHTITSRTPDFDHTIDPATQAATVSGPGEGELESLILRLRDEFGIPLNVGAPQVAYRETISRAVTRDHTHKKQIDGIGQYARVKIRFEPVESEAPISLLHDASSVNLPPAFVEGVRAGIDDAGKCGVIAGFPMIGVRAILEDAAWHETDSHPAFFEAAARACQREALPLAGPVLLEPVMKVEIVTPEGFLGDVVFDLQQRRARDIAVIGSGDMRKVEARTPLANMFGYQNSLAFETERLGTFEMRFDSYQPVPRQLPPDDSPGAVALRS